MRYSINLHFNKVFKGNATTVKGQLLSLRDIYKGMPIFDMKAFFIKKISLDPHPLEHFPLQILRNIHRDSLVHGASVLPMQNMLRYKIKEDI